MITHTLACALFCNSDGSPNSGAQFLADSTLVVFAVAAVIGAFVRIGRAMDRRKRGLPPQPVLSPFAASLLSGRNVPAYWSAVSAVTPSGVRIRWARCCPQGHQTPDQAVAHAGDIAARIGMHGR